MSSSSSSSTTSDKIFLLRKDQQNDTDISQLAERLLPQSESTASNTSETHSTTAQQEAEAESCGIIRSESEEKNLKLKAEEKQEEDDDDGDDGFRTPTSLEHRIPEPKQCPAPPRKPKPSLKRKADHSQTSFTSSSSSCIRRNPLDLSIEVELLLFRIQQHNPISANSHRQNPKKSRTNQCK